MTGDWRPALAPSIVFRHDPVREQEQLVMPERVVVLTGPAAEIIRRCDGTRTVPEIIDELSAGYPGAPVADDVREFVDKVKREGWVR